MFTLSRSLLVTAAAGIFLLGCASTTIYPEGNGIYSLVTTSSDQGFAESDAEKKAGAQCTALNKQLVVISHSTTYQGVDKKDAALIGLASTILTPGSNSSRSNNDYQVTMKFKCQ